MLVLVSSQSVGFSRNVSGLDDGYHGIVLIYIRLNSESRTKRSILENIKN